MAGLSVGDAVDVTFSGVVEANVGQGYVGVKLDDGLIHWVKETHVTSTGAKYETFKSGDVVVRHNGAARYALGIDGYLNLTTGKHYRYGIDGFSKSHFVSSRFGRVPVG